MRHNDQNILQEIFLKRIPTMCADAAVPTKPAEKAARDEELSLIICARCLACRAGRRRDLRGVGAQSSAKSLSDGRREGGGGGRSGRRKYTN